MALAGLVADYSDSSGEEDTTDTPINITNTASTQETSTDFFSATQSDSDDESDEVTPSDKDTLPTPNLPSMLPNPLAGSRNSLGQSEASVFDNRFAVEEKAKRAIFEKHVKMTEDRVSSQLPCFKFKKGACLKGKNCRFSHDRGFQAPSKAAEKANEVHLDPGVCIQSPDFKPVKKRVGVTNTLQPAKKAKGALQAQRSKERPWTMHSSS